MNEPINKISEEIIGCAIAVHRQLGPGLLEKHYESAFCVELKKRKIPFKQQYPVRVLYDGLEIDKKYRLDLVVHDKIVVQIKCVERFAPIHVQQVNTYLQISGLPLGLLLNFNVKLMKNGIRRVLPGRDIRTGRSVTSF